jgi:hypothetical protein
MGVLFLASKASAGAACKGLRQKGTFLSAFIDLTHEKDFGLWKLV